MSLIIVILLLIVIISMILLGKSRLFSIAKALCALISVVMLFYGLSIMVDPDPLLRPMVSGVLRFVYGVAGLVCLYGMFQKKKWGGQWMIVTLLFGIFVGSQGASVMADLGLVTERDVIAFLAFWVLIHLALILIIGANLKNLK